MHQNALTASNSGLHVFGQSRRAPLLWGLSDSIRAKRTLARPVCLTVPLELNLVGVKD
jgi:hypothetical protein